MQLLLLAPLTFGAAIVFGATGFGFAVLLMGLFPIIIGIKDANVVVTLLGIVLPLYLLYPIRHYIRWRVLAPVLVATAVGIPLGVWGLVRFPESIMMRSLGAFLILYLAYDLFIKGRLGKSVSPAFGYVAGGLGGAFAGAFTAGGPPVVAYFTSLDLGKHALKANILVFIFLTVIYKIGFFIYHGLITVETIEVAAVLLVPSFLGMFVGQFLFSRMPTKLFQRVVQALLFLSAVYMILTA